MAKLTPKKQIDALARAIKSGHYYMPDLEEAAKHYLASEPSDGEERPRWKGEQSRGAGRLRMNSRGGTLSLHAQLIEFTTASMSRTAHFLQ